MVKAIIELFIALLNLVQAEARTLRRMVVNLGWGLAFIAIAALLVVVAAVFFLWGLHQYFAALLSPVASSFIVSAAALLLAAIAGWAARQRVR